MRSHQLHRLLLPLFGLILAFGTGFAQITPVAVWLYKLDDRANSHPLVEKVKSLYPLELDDQLISKIAKARVEEMEVYLPIDKSTVKHINFKLSESVPAVVTTTTSAGKQVQVNPGVHYRASGAGWMAALSLVKDAKGNNQLVGVYSEVGKGNWVIGKSRKLGKHFIYNDADLPARNPFHCDADDLKENLEPMNRFQAPSPDAQRQGGVSCKSIKMYVETDYKCYVDNGFSVPATVAWVYSVFNVIGVIYDRESIMLEVTETFTLTKPDKYPDSKSSLTIAAFRDSLSSRRTVTANLAHLLSTEATNLGGIAGLDVLCTSNVTRKAGFSNCDLEFQQLPTYSWTANVIAHEIGHNIGSPHTQNCNWEVRPGIFTAIDSCYPVEGGCYTGPIIGREGTIMSYCHITGNTNLALGFGPLPGALIRSKYDNATCLTSGLFIASLTVPSADTVCQGGNVSITPSLVQNASYSWDGPNNFSSSQRTLALNNLQVNQAGTYYLTVTKDGCSTSPRPVYVHLDCIPVSAASQPLACAGVMASVPYTTTFANTGGNTFYVELSNAAGQFSGTNFIDTIANAAAKGTLTFMLPASASTGNGYKVRLRTPSPLRIGSAIPVAFIIGSKLAAPTGTGATRPTPGTLTLSATATNSVIQWYDVPTGGAVLGTGNSFTTPSLPATKTYYAEANPGQKFSVGPATKTGLSGGNLNNFSQGLYFTVASPVRIDSVRVYPTSAGTVNITITRLGTLDQVFERGIPLTSTAAAGVKIPVMANLPAGRYIINAEGSTVSGLYRSVGMTGYPYQVGGLISIDSSTAPDAHLENYYFFFGWRVTKFGCPSNRTPVVATIGSNCTPPAAPTANNIARCGLGAIALTASGATAGQSYRWYTQGVGGASQASTANFTTPSLTRTDTFYVSIVVTSNPTCESTRKMVIATVNPVPAVPTANNASRCGSGTLTLTASGAAAGQTYAWFIQAAGGGVVANTASYIPPSLTRTDTFYVALVGTGSCQGPRKMVIATVNAAPAVPTTTGAQRCGPGQVTLNASGAAAGERYAWFDRLTGGTEITPQPGAAYAVNLTRTDTFYVARVSGACSGARAAVMGRINPTPTTPIITRVGDSLMAGTAVTGATYAWTRNTVPVVGQTRRSIYIADLAPGNYSFTAMMVVPPCSSAVSQAFAFTITGLDDAVGNSSIVQAYPNPFHQTLTLQIGQPVQRLTVTDPLGRQVLIKMNLRPGTATLPASHLAKGLYHITATLPGGEVVKLKAVKE